MELNIDVSSEVPLGRHLAIFAIHKPIDSVMGFTYSSFKAIDKYLKILPVDVELFNKLVSADKNTAIQLYKDYQAGGGTTIPTKHHRCIMLFLMWERAKRDVAYYDALIELYGLYKTVKLVSYNAVNKSTTRYSHWLIKLLIELCYSVATNRVPNFNKMTNANADTEWTQINGYDGDILEDIKTIRQLPIPQ